MFDIRKLQTNLQMGFLTDGHRTPLIWENEVRKYNIVNILFLNIKKYFRKYDRRM